MKNNCKIRTVLVGMSGGIDSSVAAWLLKNQGFQVTGLYLKMNNLKKDKNLERTRKVATTLKIQLIEKNISKEFEKEVKEYFIKTYKRNQTPNPCVICNRQIKFRFMLQEAKKKRIEYIATGHYARVAKGKNNLIHVLKGVDKSKDQSYFLYQLTQKELKKTIFPLGKYKKSEIYKIASQSSLKKINFYNESQDACFLNNKKKLKNFLSEKISNIKTGNIVDDKGNKLGTHQGLIFYTKGQRQGLSLPGGPFFVIRKKIKSNQLMVTRNRKHPLLLSDKIILIKANWIANKPRKNKKYYFKVRYQGQAISGSIKKTRKNWIAKAIDPLWAVTSGQSLVAYDGKKVLGGGIIKGAE